ncbi:MAG TPA: 2-C-methyl-D-erythritol 2,4-cyclodiphosphate synthase [Candidatus Babeliales bacterium]|nr:2-C-methyl-D-erythritol 2,4-cyclodiphosphate synthase [Candidatus Babeliales bacterium]
MMRIGHGFDAHRLVEGRALILGGARIPFDRGPLGHSDGDVLAHALADALLGAAALGDLGSRFPATDSRWKDADSMELLSRCVAVVRDAGFAIVNVDATIVVERPRLAPFIAQMRSNLASRIGIGADAVSVKAKTSDGMGYTGDATGLAVYAVALLTKK